MRRTADRDGARHGHRARVADAQPPFGNAKVKGDLRGTAREPDPRWRTRRAEDDDIGERDATSESRAQRFQDSFLRGEPTRQPLNSVGPIAHFVEFLLNEAAWDQRIARIVDPAPHLGDVHQIDPVPDNTHIRRLSLPSRP